MYYIHINRNVIDSNRNAHEVSLPAGSRIIYDHAGTILPCGARLVIMSEEAPIVVPNTD
jgi:hypothetical protein